MRKNIERTFKVYTDNYDNLINNFEVDKLTQFAPELYDKEEIDIDIAFAIEEKYPLDIDVEAEDKGASSMLLYIITDMEKFMGDMCSSASIIGNAVHHKLILLVETDDNAEEINLLKRKLYEKSCCAKLKVTTFNQFLVELASRKRPSQCTVAFISDNFGFIDNLFDQLTYSIDDSDNEDIDYNKTTGLSIPFSPKLPKIFEGWIWRIWYGTSNEGPSEDNDITEVNEENVEDKAYIRQSISIRLSDNRTVTYVHIVPSYDLDLAGCTDMFDTVFFDLCSTYGRINISKPTIQNFILFVSIHIPAVTVKNKEIILNTVANILKIKSIGEKDTDKICNGKPIIEYTAEDSELYHPLDKSMSVFTLASSILFGDIYTINRIDPGLEYEITDDGDTE